MIVCPLCEHTQAQGVVCEQCGKTLVAPRPVAVAAAPLPELERTATAETAAAEVSAERLPELEPNAFRVPKQVSVEPVPELERTRMEAVDAVPEPVADLDLGRAADDGVRTAAPQGSVTCRYCRNVQATGMLCDKCGMRLPRAAVAAVRAVKSTREAPTALCRKCGGKGREGQPCPSCGVPIPVATP